MKIEWIEACAMIELEIIIDLRSSAKWMIFTPSQ